MKYQRIVRGVLSAAVLLLLPLSTGIIHAQEATVRIKKRVILAQDGSTAQVKLKVSCPADMEVLEAFVYIVQNDNQSPFGGFNPLCDGQLQTVLVTVNASPEDLFIKGKANATAYLLLIDPATQSTLSADATRRVKLKPKP